ncbi:MAG: threonine synthase [Candidatus Diapherotrites archaeon]
MLWVGQISESTAGALKCIECGKEYPLFEKPLYRCDCSGLLEVHHDLEALKETVSLRLFDKRLNECSFPVNSGVWRYKELILPEVSDKTIVSRLEGNTRLYPSGRKLAEFVGLKEFFLKHEGENPTGSFKDRGMTTGITAANALGTRTVACASTGNTSASMASYAAFAGMQSMVFVPSGNISFGKLAQALAYGSKTFEVDGNFDDAMKLVQEVCAKLRIYLLNSINPFRIEGQKAIVFELLQQMQWNSPDWIVLPGGNLGNTSAFGKALMELKALGLIEKIPRLAVIQASGANPFYSLWKSGREELKPITPDTIASAIKIGNPVSWKKAFKAVKWSGGTVEEASDEEIMAAKLEVDAAGIGAEPASCASIAGMKKLVEAGTIDRKEKVACILTGNLLKDPGILVDFHAGKGVKGAERLSGKANRPEKIPADINAVEKSLKAYAK